MAKRMLFNISGPDEVRGAIMDNGSLIEYDIETSNRKKSRTNIYLGYVVKVEPSIQVAFIEYGAERHGFLPFGSIHRKFWNRDPNSFTSRPRIDEVIDPGQPVLVQVLKEAVDQKGAALTTYCTLPGRYLVLMPYPKEDGGAISRKIEDPKARRALQKIMKELESPEGFGYIVRTAGMGRSYDELNRELSHLVRLWKSILKEAEYGPRVRVVFQDSDLILRMMRDYFDEEIEEIWVDDKRSFERADAYAAAIAPDKPGLVKFYEESKPLFSKYTVENQIAGVYERRVALPSGGSIVIDSTEALVAIDVNSGKTQSNSGTEETALKTNLEAVQEIARQLRLRDLGGLIVIDFIGMHRVRNVRVIERAMRDAVKKDKARIRIGRISSLFGLLSLSRQRIREAKDQGHFMTCPSCEGMGKVPTPGTIAALIVRRIIDAANSGVYRRIDVALPTEVAMFLLNQKRADLAEVEREFQVEVVIKPRSGHNINLEKDLTFYARTDLSPVDRYKRNAGAGPRKGQTLPHFKKSAQTQRDPGTHAKNRRPSAPAIQEPSPGHKIIRPAIDFNGLEMPLDDDPATQEPLEDDVTFPLAFTKFPELPEGLPWFIPMLSPKFSDTERPPRNRKRNRRDRKQRDRRDRDSEDGRHKNNRRNQQEAQGKRNEQPETQERNDDQNRQKRRDRRERQNERRDRRDHQEQAHGEQQPRQERGERKQRPPRNNRRDREPRENRENGVRAKQTPESVPQEAVAPKPSNETARPSKEQVAPQKQSSKKPEAAQQASKEPSAQALKPVQPAQNEQQHRPKEKQHNHKRRDERPQKQQGRKPSAEVKKAPQAAPDKATPKASDAAVKDKAPKQGANGAQAPAKEAPVAKAATPKAPKPSTEPAPTKKEQSQKKPPASLWSPEDLMRIRKHLGESQKDNRRRGPQADGRDAGGRFGGLQEARSPSHAEKIQQAVVVSGGVLKKVGSSGAGHKAEKVNGRKKNGTKREARSSEQDAPVVVGTDGVPFNRRAWSEEEIHSLRAVRHLPVNEAYKQFEDRGFKRSFSAFKQRYYRTPMAKGQNR